MFRLSVPLLLAACASPDALPTDAAGPVLALAMDAPSAMLRGEPVPITVSGLPPNRAVWLLGVNADVGGRRVCPPDLGGCTDLWGPYTIAAQGIADAGGTAALMVSVPDLAPVQTVGLQAVSRLGPDRFLSAPVRLPVLEGDEDEDLDGLLNRAEVLTWSTNPSSADSDGGGTEDLPEVLGAGTDPNSPADDTITWGCDGQPTGTRVGDCAPDYLLADANGQVHSIHDLRGWAAIIDVSAMWCINCQNMARETPSLLSALAGQGLRVTTILFEDNLSRPPDAADLLQWAQVYPPAPHDVVLADPGGVYKSRWGAGSIPILVMLDRDGRIVAKQNNYWGVQPLIQALQPAL